MTFLAARVVTRSSLVAVVSFALVSSAGSARADEPTKEQCLTAHQQAQSLRRAAKLQASRAQLLICITSSCPGPVRDDCAERLNEVDRAIPTIVFTAKGTADADLSSVKVTMDGVAVAERLDGTALNVEPGEHTFEFSADGYPRVSRKLVISEGVKGRHEVIAFATAHGPEVPPVVGPVVPTEIPPVTPTDAPPSEPAASGYKTAGFVVGGVGIVGVALGAFFGLRASSKWSSAKDGCVVDRCGPNSQAQMDKDDASSAGTVSTIAFVIGGAALVTGVTLLVLAPSSSKGTSSASLRVVPGLGGLAAVGAF